MGKSKKNYFLEFSQFFGLVVSVVRVDLPHIPLKYGPRTTSRSEVIDFTVNDFFGAKWGNYTPLSPPLVFLHDQSQSYTAPHFACSDNLVKAIIIYVQTITKGEVALLHTWHVWRVLLLALD